MPSLFSVEQLAKAQPRFTQASIRWLIFREKENGLSKSGAILRVGRRVLIDEEKFVEWIRAQNRPQP